MKNLVATVTLRLVTILPVARLQLCVAACETERGRVGIRKHHSSKFPFSGNEAEGLQVAMLSPFGRFVTKFHDK